MYAKLVIPWLVFQVRVGSELKTGNFATYKLLGKFASPTSSTGYVKFSKRQGIVGRYVSIQQNVYGNFFVCDVVVLADDWDGGWFIFMVVALFWNGTKHIQKVKTKKQKVLS